MRIFYPPGGGGGTPGGADTQIQFNNGGAFDGDSTLTWDTSLARLTVGTLFDTPDETSLAVERDYTNNTYGNISEEIRVSVRSQGSGDYTTGRVGVSARMMDSTSVVNKTITGAADNGSGLIRITATSHGFTTGDLINIYGIVGTTEAIGSWTITAITANTFDLVGSTFSNAYVSGGIATNRGLLYGMRIFLGPTLDRGGPTIGTGAYGDDVNGLAIQNYGTGKATEAVYIADSNNVTGSGWYAVFSSPAKADYGLLLTGEYAATSSNTSLPGAAVWVRPNHTTNNTTTETQRNVYIKPTLNFGGSNTNKTVNLLEVDSTNTVTTGATVNPFRLSYGGTRRLNVSSDGLIQNYVEGAFNPQSHRFSANTGGISQVMIKGRGSFAAPRRAQSGDVLGGMITTGYYAVDDSTDAAFDATSVSASFRALTLEAFTSTARGAYAQIQTVPVGSTTAAQRARFDVTGVQIGQTIASRSTTEPTNALTIYDGTAPVGTLTNGISLYSTAGELRVMDAAGNATLLSPHEKGTNYWIYDSVLSTTGKRLRIDVERLLRAMDAQLGGGYIHES